MLMLHLVAVLPIDPVNKVFKLQAQGTVTYNAEIWGHAMAPKLISEKQILTFIWRLPTGTLL